MKEELNQDKILEIDENATVIFVQGEANSKYFLYMGVCNGIIIICSAFTPFNNKWILTAGSAWSLGTLSCTLETVKWANSYNFCGRNNIINLSVCVVVFKVENYFLEMFA